MIWFFHNLEPDPMRRILEEGLKDYKENDRAEAIRRWSLQHTWKKTAAEYAGVYRQLLSDGR